MLEWIDTVLLNYLFENPKLMLVGLPHLSQQSSTTVMDPGANSVDIALQSWLVKWKKTQDDKEKGAIERFF